MKAWILVAAAMLVAAPVRADAPMPAAPHATYIPQDKVQAALDGKADLHLMSADNMGVEGCFRDKPGVVELHDKLTDVIYVTDGEATFVVGGQYEGGKRVSAGQVRGGTISGGATYHLVKGDAIVVPAGIPHWFKDVPKSVSYFVVKIVEK
jgi:quercetin dioxygenase-like cupin family protein